MGFATKLYVLLGVFIFGFLLFAGVSQNTIATIKVTGPVYGKIVDDKDLVADILPPPKYIIEPYLVVLQALDPKQKDASRLASKIKQLREDYDTRHKYWEKELEPGQKKDLLLKESHIPAEAFFSLVDK